MGNCQLKYNPMRNSNFMAVSAYKVLTMKEIRQSYMEHVKCPAPYQCREKHLGMCLKRPELVSQVYNSFA